MKYDMKVEKYLEVLDKIIDTYGWIPKIDLEANYTNETIQGFIDNCKDEFIKRVSLTESKSIIEELDAI